MVVQATVAGDLLDRDRAAAAAALQQVAQAGRDALAETGRLLRLIRDDRDELGLQGGAAAAELGPPTPPAKQSSVRASIRPADVVLPALFGVIGTVETVWEGYGPLWGSIGAYWLAAIVLCARRAFPLVMPVARCSDHPRRDAGRRRNRRAGLLVAAARSGVPRRRSVCAAIARAGRAGERPGLNGADRRRCRQPR